MWQKLTITINRFRLLSNLSSQFLSFDIKMNGEIYGKILSISIIDWSQAIEFILKIS
jgi:hypothetical protein